MGIVPRAYCFFTYPFICCFISASLSLPPQVCEIGGLLGALQPRIPVSRNINYCSSLFETFVPQVREIGGLLGVPQQFIKRHPFPGPGLAVRVLGDVTDGTKLDTLREVDEIFVNTIKEFGLYDQIWQAFAVFLPVKSVGVQVRRSQLLLLSLVTGNNKIKRIDVKPCGLPARQVGRRAGARRAAGFKDCRLRYNLYIRS